MPLSASALVLFCGQKWNDDVRPIVKRAPSGAVVDAVDIEDAGTVSAGLSANPMRGIIPFAKAPARYSSRRIRQLERLCLRQS